MALGYERRCTLPRTESPVKDEYIKPFGLDLRVAVPKKRVPTMTLLETGTGPQEDRDTDFANTDTNA